jgi:homoserine kinase
MAVYTDITDEELGTLLADFDIGAPLSLKGVAEGIENSNFLLETETGRFILTIYEKRVRADDLPYFLDLLTWLSQHGFPGAEPVADRQGRTLKSVRGKPAAIVSVSPGAIGAFGANHHLRQPLVFLNMPTMQQPEAYVGNVAGLLNEEDGRLKNEGTREFLKEFLDAFAAWIEKTK